MAHCVFKKVEIFLTKEGAYEGLERFDEVASIKAPRSGMAAKRQRIATPLDIARIRKALKRLHLGGSAIERLNPSAPVSYFRLYVTVKRLGGRATRMRTFNPISRFIMLSIYRALPEKLARARAKTRRHSPAAQNPGQAS